MPRGTALIAAIVLFAACTSEGGSVPRARAISTSIPLVPTSSPTGPATKLRQPGEVAFLPRGGTGGLYARDRRTNETRKLMSCVKPCVLIHEFAWSPDGRWIAYDVWTYITTTQCDPSDEGLWVMGATGEPRHVLDACEVGGMKWEWSPDGSAIFVTTQDGTSSIDPSTGSRTSVRGRAVQRESG